MITFGYKNKFSGVLRALAAIAIGLVMVCSTEATTKNEYDYSDQCDDYIGYRSREDEQENTYYYIDSCIDHHQVQHTLLLVGKAVGK